jgi:phosphoenolpyruvate synthase/pyruvate phosphate dikinase
MTALILNWRQAYEAGVLTCGSKGYHLAKLHRYGFPVPDGGVVVADVYRQLIHYAILGFLGPHIDTAIAALPEMKGAYR